MADQLITIEQARQEVLSAVQPLAPERLPIVQALDRVLAQNVEADVNVPPFASSAMDGYAVPAGSAGAELQVVGESRAGMPTAHRLGPGEAIRISTGASVPTGADAVIPQENVEERQELAIRTLADVQPGEHIRPAGEVMSAGTTILRRGSALGPVELAAAISAGVAEVAVGRRPRTHILATGDELRDPGERLGPGEIHDSNGPMLAGLARHAGAVAAGTTRLPDDRTATEQGLAVALEDADVVIVAGGVSVGPHDHVKPALARLDVRERFWGVALQPGKPTWFGVRGRKLVFGLPGNPVSAAVTFSLFVAPAIAALQGGAVGAGFFAEAVLGESVRQNRRREQAVRVRLERRDGGVVAIPNGPQGSHVITSLVGADALALIPQGDSVLEAGTAVGLQPLPR